MTEYLDDEYVSPEEIEEAPSPAEDAALAVGGEGAVELEAGAPTMLLDGSVGVAVDLEATAEGPAVPVPPEFPLKNFVRLVGDDTPEAIEEQRLRVERSNEHRYIGQGGGKARAGMDPIHPGGKRQRWNPDKSKKRFST